MIWVSVLTVTTLVVTSVAGIRLESTLWLYASTVDFILTLLSPLGIFIQVIKFVDKWWFLPILVILVPKHLLIHDSLRFLRYRGSESALIQLFVHDFAPHLVNLVLHLLSIVYQRILCSFVLWTDKIPRCFIYLGLEWKLLWIEAFLFILSISDMSLQFFLSLFNKCMIHVSQKLFLW